MPKISHKDKIIRRSSNLSFKSKAKKQKGGVRQSDGTFNNQKTIIHNFEGLLNETADQFKAEKAKDLNDLQNNVKEAVKERLGKADPFLIFPPRGTCLYTDPDSNLKIASVHLTGGRYDEAYLSTPLHHAKHNRWKKY